jgi:hypothetical protein
MAMLAAACGGSLASPTAQSDASGTMGDAGADGAIGKVTAPDCPGCTFPPPGASPCTSAPAIKIVYPPDTALLPPNLGTISVQWVPYGSEFVRFEVDFTQSAQSPITDWRIVTACSQQTTDQRDAGSGGCELIVDPASWAPLAQANRGGEPISITVRGTTDGTCASTSQDTIHVSLAEEDVPGTYFYWKSDIALLGQSGQVWAQNFGQISIPPQDVTSPIFQQPLCSGCHSLSRDGSRMLVYPVDDTDPDYQGLEGSFLDMTQWPDAGAPVLSGCSTAAACPGQPPGLSAIASTGTSYLTSNGLPCQATATNTCPQAESATYPSAVPVNAFSLWDQRGTFIGPIAMGASGMRPTMPDWSVDGASVVFVQPAAIGSWDNSARHDDDHLFGGSLYSAPYNGGGAFGAPGVLVASQGENNYYPSFSPDVPASFVLFDRAALDTSVATLTGCIGTIPNVICPNDSFANPNARLMLVANAAGATPVDLETANGSPTKQSTPLSNSYPRFAPFIQTYKGKRLFWVTFSSTRDYALRVLNHENGMSPCYPSDSYEWPGSVHRNIADTLCEHPQLWMAPVLEAAGQGSTSDPSGVAFWIPYQDPTTHNHMASWTWKPQASPGGTCSCSMVGGACGPANGGCGCCSGANLVCSGDGTCIAPTR